MEGRINSRRLETTRNIALLCLMLVSIVTQARSSGTVKFIASGTRALVFTCVHADLAHIERVYLLAMNIIDALSGCLLEGNIIAR